MYWFFMVFVRSLSNRYLSNRDDFLAFLVNSVLGVTILVVWCCWALASFRALSIQCWKGKSFSDKLHLYLNIQPRSNLNAILQSSSAKERYTKAFKSMWD